MSCSYHDRQEDELLFLQEVFPTDFEDLRKKDPWKMNRPPEIRVRIFPEKSNDLRDKLFAVLRVKYPTNYPDDVPEVAIEECKGISDAAKDRLSHNIQSLTNDFVGEVMMFQVIQHIQIFLDSNDQQKQPSLYEEMVLRKKKEAAEKELRLREENETKEKIIEQEINEELKRQAELRGGGRSKKVLVSKQEEAESRVSMAVKVNSPVVGKRSPNLPQKTTADVVGDPKFLDVTKGKLLGESSSGHSVYVGMDVSGELVAVYEWTLQCRPTKKNQTESGMVTTRRSKQVQSIQQELNSLRWITHKNLASYHSMKYKVEADTISVRLCMEYVHGSNLQHLIGTDGKSFPFEKITLITQQVLDGLAHLHSHGVVHKDLRLTMVFLDATESVKLVGYSVLRRLTDLYKSVNVQQKLVNGDEGTLPIAMTTDQIGGKRGDLVKLGLLVLSLTSNEVVTSPPESISSDVPDVMKDFVAKCLNTDNWRSLSFRDLLVHPFLSTTPTVGMSLAGKSLHHQPSINIADSPQDKFLLLGSPVMSQSSLPQPKSRLKSEFEELDHLGQGGFGDVIKVRNHLDGRIYAIKCVRLHPELKSMNRKIMREVKLLSQLNHENVVRYYNAWIESYAADDLPLMSVLEEDEDSLLNQSTHSHGSSVDLERRTGTFTSGDDDDDSTSDEDSFISFEVPSVNEGEPVIVFEENSNSTLSSGSGGGGDSIAHSFDDPGDMVFSMSPSEYKWDTKNILALIDREVYTSDRSDPVIFHRSMSKESIDKTEIPKQMPHRPSSGPLQIRYLYIQMEFCENRTLRHLIGRGELHQDDDMLWRLLREITEGLNHIHKQGMIHRDLKPGNIFLDINGRVKIGDFGLATSYGFTRKASMIPPGEVSMVDYVGKQDFSGPVGTFLYTSPEILMPQWEGKFTQKVDIYSLGIIFFEMCHPPWVTEMERQIVLNDLRKCPPMFPGSFDEFKMKNKFVLLKEMLDHNPHKRPSAEEILMSNLLPRKMEEEELLDVLKRTLSSTNSTSYQRLMHELFEQPVSKANEFAYFYDLQTVKCTLPQTVLHQKIQGKIQSVFERHNALHLATPLLMPKCHQLKDMENAVMVMDSSGGLVVMPYDLRVSLAKFVAMHDITDLRRFTMDRVYRESGVQRLNFTHPRETIECAFDIITGDTKELIPDAECIRVVWEIVNEFPVLKAQNYVIHLNHVSLLKAVLDFCSVPSEKQKDLLRIHHLLSTGGVNIEDVLSKELKITKLAATQLGKFVYCGVSVSEAKSLLEQLFKDKTSIGTLANQGWHEIETVVSHLTSMGISKDMILVNVGMIQSINMYCGVLFQFRKTQKRKHKKLILAAGGRYDRLISSFQVPSRTKTGRPIRGVGVSVSEDHVFALVHKTLSPTPQQLEVSTGGGVLVHWLGLEPCTGDCIKVATMLWRKGIPAQLFYSTADTMDELWTYCQRNSISCLVVLPDRFYKEKNQMKVRTVENGRVLEKLVNGKDLVDYILQKQKGYVRNTDTPELMTSVTKQSSLSMNDLNAPQINFSVVSLQKIPGYIKRKVQDQAYNKVSHIAQKLKCPAEVLSVELDSEVLSSIVAMLTKQSEVKEGLADVVKQVCEKCPKANKKLVNKLCEEIHTLFVHSKCPLVVLHSTECSADQVHVLLNHWD
jgi:translation initiation factor 2-alpha kinase 4